MKKPSSTKKKLQNSSVLTKEPKTRVLACGTFDNLHKGHLFFLKSAAKLGNELFLIVSRDQNVKKIKNKKPIHTEKIRKKKLEALPFITKVFLGNKKDFLKSVIKIKPAILVLGYDQTLPFKKVDLKSKIPKIKLVRLKPLKPHLYKTSLLKNANSK